MSRQPVLEELEAEWAALAPRVRDSAADASTRVEDLQRLLERCIEAGLAISGEEHRRELQRVAREIGGAVATRTHEYPNTVIKPAACLWNLPRQGEQLFTDRETLLMTLHTMLARQGRVALCGMPGVGKTMIALHYAHQHEDEYASGVWINAHTVDTIAGDCRAIAGDLGLTVQLEPDARRVVAAVRAWLEGQEKSLLILDNAEEWSVVRTVLPSSGSGRVLITTRAPNPVGIAVPLSVDVMGEVEGAELVLRRAGLVSPAVPSGERVLSSRAEEAGSAGPADWGVAREISREVEGLPLALEQAGAYVASHRITLARYLAAYRDWGAWLRAEPTKEGISKQPVTRTFALAFQRVEEANPAAADLLRLCAFLAPDAIPEELFVVGAPELREPLRQVAQDEFALDEAIEETARYSLLRRDVTACTLTVHRVTQDVLKDRMTEEERRWWAEVAVRTIYRASAAVEVYDRLRGERLLPHVRAGAGWVEEFRMTFSEAGRLLHHMAFYLTQRSDYQEAKILGERALAIAEKAGDRDGEAGTWHQLALIDLRLDDYGSAREKFDKSLSIARERQDPLGEAAIWQNLAFVDAELGDYKAAREKIGKALEIAQGIGDRMSEAGAWHNLATIDLHRGEYQEARRQYEQSLQVKQEIGNRAGEAATWHQLATLDMYQGDTGAARAKFGKALEIAQEMGNRTGEAATWHQLAALDLATGDHAAARKKFDRSLAIEQEIGNRAGEADSWRQLATIDTETGDHDAARVKLERTLAIRQEIGDRVGEAATWHYLGKTYVEKKEYDEARAKLGQALAITREIGDRPGEAAISYDLAGMDWESGNNKGARAGFQQALHIYREMGDQTGVSDTLNGLALVEVQEGRFAAARDVLRQVLSIAQEAGDQADEAATWEGLASIDLEVGRYAEAHEEFARALQIHQGRKNLAGEAATFYQLGILAERQGKVAEGARLVAVSCLIDREIDREEAEGDIRALKRMVAQLEYTPEQLQKVLNEVASRYREDRGRSLLTDIL